MLQFKYAEMSRISRSFFQYCGYINWTKLIFVQNDFPISVAIYSTEDMQQILTNNF